MCSYEQKLLPLGGLEWFRMRVTEKLRVVDADTLLSTPLEKTAFVVDGLIPMGVTLLGGSSKIYCNGDHLYVAGR